MYEKACGNFMNREEITRKLSKILVDKKLSGLGRHYASEVTIDYGQGKGKQKRVDYILFEPENQLSVAGIEHGTFTCYEIKSCKEDIYSGNGLNFIGDKNYLVTTMDCWIDISDDLAQTNKLRDHVKACNPESSLSFGVMVAIPDLRGQSPHKIAVAEYENPTAFEDWDYWTLYTVHQCNNGYRTRSTTEMLFNMLRSGK